MQSAVPVVDHAKRAVIDEIKGKSPFNIFNIVAIVAILIIGYFLYKKFTEKFQKGAINIPQVSAPIKKESVSIVAQAAEVPPPEDDEVVPA